MTTTDTSRLLGFPAHRVEEARDALAKAYARFCRSAAKAGQVAPAAPRLVTVGDPRVVSRCQTCQLASRGWLCDATRGGCGRGPVVTLEEVDVEVTGERPVLAGWDFLAVVEPLEGGNLLRQVPGADVREGELEGWRSGPVRCDHCGVARRRTETFVVRADGSDPAVTAGTYKQVGRSCLEAFLGGKSAAHIVAALGWPSVVLRAAGDQDEGGGWFNSAPRVHDPVEFLGWVCGIIREDGWLSRGAAREAQDAGGGGRATSDFALYLMVPEFGSQQWARHRERCAPAPADLKRAAAALAWARGLAPTSDYERNLSLVARQAALRPAHAGILASAVTAHGRVLAREVERARLASAAATTPSRHVGEVKQRLNLDVVVQRVIEVESDWGACNIIVMRDSQNNLFVWKTGAQSAKPGETLKLRATVKRHGDFRGELQTELTRGEVFDEWPPAKPAKLAKKTRAKEPAPATRAWSVGDEVSFPATYESSCRTVHTGRIADVSPGELAPIARVECDGVTHAVSPDFLHRPGAFEVLPDGPVGIRWLDQASPVPKSTRTRAKRPGISTPAQAPPAA
jgi:hypothetical protein